MDVMSAAQAAKKWKVSRQRVHVWLKENRIPGAVLKMHFGRRIWEIPAACKKPETFNPYGLAKSSE